MTNVLKELSKGSVPAEVLSIANVIIFNNLDIEIDREEREEWKSIMDTNRKNSIPTNSSKKNSSPYKKCSASTSSRKQEL